MWMAPFWHFEVRSPLHKHQRCGRVRKSFVIKHQRLKWSHLWFVTILRSFSLPSFPKAMRTSFYYDEVEIVNLIGSKAGSHKVGAFKQEVRFQNIPDQIKSEFPSVQAPLLCNYEDSEKYEFVIIWHPFHRTSSSSKEHWKLRFLWTMRWNRFYMALSPLVLFVKIHLR